jgi:hypothetical protein
MGEIPETLFDLRTKISMYNSSCYRKAISPARTPP